MHEIDIGEVFVVDGVDVDVARQIAARPAVHVFHCSLVPRGVRSRAQVRTRAMGKPIARATMTAVANHSGSLSGYRTLRIFNADSGVRSTTAHSTLLFRLTASESSAQVPKGDFEGIFRAERVGRMVVVALG